MNLTAQAYDYEFVGTIQLVDKSLITYKLQFNASEDGTIKGKSITDFAGDHRTESRIKGNIDTEQELISFQEYENISTISDYPDSTFCFVHVYDARVRLKNDKSVIQGHFYGRYKDNSICAEADLYLMSENFMLEKMERLMKKAKLVIKDEKLEKTEEGIASTKENLKNIILESDEVFKYQTSSDQITLKVFDPEYEDGDLLSIILNGETLLDNYSVKKEPRLITIELAQEITNIQLVANGEGKIPPNSANIDLLDRDEVSPLKLKLNRNAEVLISIKKTTDQ